MISSAVIKLRTFTLPLILMIGVALFGVAALGYVLWQSQRPVNQTELEQQVVEFLKTTDVKNVWDGTLEIKELYDHKPGGNVVIVEYTTPNGGHPDFMLEIIERHTAVITLNEKSEVISAFCVHGSLQEGQVWDLLNQRWISQNP